MAKQIDGLLFGDIELLQLRLVHVGIAHQKRAVRAKLATHGSSGLAKVQEHGFRLLEIALPGIAETGNDTTINHPVITSPGNRHDSPLGQLALRIEAWQPLALANRDNGQLRSVDDRCRIGPPKGADIGDADSAILEIFLGHPAGTSVVGQALNLAGQRQHATTLDPFDIGYEQARPAIHRHADIDAGQIVNLAHLLVETGIEQWLFVYRQRHCLHEKRHQGETYLLGFGKRFEAFTQGQQLGHVNFVTIVKVRDGARRFHHAPGHDRTNTANRLDTLSQRLCLALLPAASLLTRLLCWRRRAGIGVLRLVQIVQYILLEYTPLLAGAGDLRQRQAMFTYQATDSGARRCASVGTRSAGAGAYTISVCLNLRGLYASRRLWRDGQVLACLIRFIRFIRFFIFADIGEKRRMHLGNLTLGHIEPGNPPRFRSGDLDQRLVGHDFDHRLILNDLVTFADAPLDYLALHDTFADIG